MKKQILDLKSKLELIEESLSIQDISHDKKVGK
jgi:hypothetical protein